MTSGDRCRGVLRAVVVPLMSSVLCYTLFFLGGTTLGSVLFLLSALSIIGAGVFWGIERIRSVPTKTLPSGRKISIIARTTSVLLFPIVLVIAGTGLYLPAELKLVLVCLVLFLGIVGNAEALSV